MTERKEGKRKRERVQSEPPWLFLAERLLCVRHWVWWEGKKQTQSLLRNPSHRGGRQSAGDSNPRLSQNEKVQLRLVLMNAANADWQPQY
jgi:hypothetical protein